MEKPELFNYVMRTNPAFTHKLVEDLLKIDIYTANEIAFAANIRLDIVRDIAYGKVNTLSQRDFLQLLKLYSYVFCEGALNFE